MAFGITVKVTLPGKKFANRKWFDEMARTQRQTSVPRLRKLFEKTVFGWSKKPGFGWSQRRTFDEMSITMYPTGQYADIWNLVSSGSPAHVIKPRKGGLLSFRPGYRAATRPGSLMSSRAYRSGKTVAAKIVNHPGFEARNFPELIAEEYRNPYVNDMQDALNRVAKNG